METAGRVYVLSAVTALVAMTDRVGWINWPAVGHVAAMGVTVMAGVATLLTLTAVVVGLPVVLVIAATAGVLRLIPAKRAGEPPA